jgi:Ca-activated chloride channel family protein
MSMSRIVDPFEESDGGSATTSEEDAGFGALETERGCLPLVALDVRARLAGLTSHVTVQQTFRNSLQEPIEATYIFPLPDRAAVTSFCLRVGDRLVEGTLKERRQARADYQDALQRGHRAGIAEEERSGTFSLRVGNIPPREEVAVELTLVGPLPVSNGEATYRFPLVVAPRYVPGVPLDGPSVGAGWGPDTDQVPDASRVTPPVLLPGFPNPVRLSLEVELDPAGLDASGEGWSESVRSSLHSTITDAGPPWTVRLKPDERLNRDFILRFRVATSGVASALQVSPGAKDRPGTFGLTLLPPAPNRTSRPRPRDVVFVLDRSGSMAGWKMVAARRAVGRMIDSLMDHDRFTILAFDNVVEYPAHANGKLVHATDRWRWRTLEWLGKIDARGGTEMGRALIEALKSFTADDSRETILVLVTDGQVAGEDVTLRAFRDSTGDVTPSVFTLGIDRAVNAGFLRRMADLGGGACELAESEEQLDTAMERIHRLIAAPALTQVRLEPVEFALASDSLAPSRLPDLYADRPFTVFGRYHGDRHSIRIRVHGVDSEGNAWQSEVVGRPAPKDVLSSLWGRAKVRELEDRYAAGDNLDPEALAKQIVNVSLECGVLSRFTAYVAVDTAEVVNAGGEQREILQPVEAPDGWDMLDMERAVALGGPSRMEFYISHGATRNRVMYERALGEPSRMQARLSKLRGRRARGFAERQTEQREAQAKIVADAVTIIGHILDQLERLHPRQSPLKQLRKLTELLHLLACSAQDPPAVLELVRRAAELLAACRQDALKEAELAGLVRDVRALLRGFTIASEQPSRRREFWTSVPGGSPQNKPAPCGRCPYCGQPLPTTKARRCLHCGMDWHDPENVVSRMCPKCKNGVPGHRYAVCTHCGWIKHPAIARENWGKVGSCPQCGFSYRWDGDHCSHCGHGVPA